MHCFFGSKIWQESGWNLIPFSKLVFAWIIKFLGQREAEKIHNTGSEIEDCRAKTFCRIYTRRTRRPWEIIRFSYSYLPWSLGKIVPSCIIVHLKGNTKRSLMMLDLIVCYFYWPDLPPIIQLNNPYFHYFSGETLMKLTSLSAGVRLPMSVRADSDILEYLFSNRQQTPGQTDGKSTRANTTFLTYSCLRGL